MARRLRGHVGVSMAIISFTDGQAGDEHKQIKRVAKAN